MSLRRLRLPVLLLAALAAVPARGGDPRLRWRTIETAHFLIHFHENERAVAQRVAAVAERAHRVLAPALKWQPRRRTHLVLTDNTDGANGSATPLPYNLIRLYVTAPDSPSQLNDYDDWLYGLIVHEYAHILHLDDISGLAYLANLVIGKTWAPNLIQPRFVIEGLATYEESKRTTGGRVRSAIFDMYLRSALLEGKLQRIDQITDGAPLAWPQGTTAYLYGSSLVAYLADRYGDDKLATLSHEYGGGNWRFWAPFGINRALRRAVGKSWVAIYNEWVEHLERRYGLQRDQAAARGLTSSTRVTSGANNQAYPFFTPDGRRLIWVQDDGHDRASWMAAAVARDGTAGVTVGSHQRVRYLRSRGRPAMSPDGRRIADDEYTPYESYYGYTDLWDYDLRTERYRRLTRGARAREPVYSPDGARLAFAQGDLGTSWLAAMPAGGGDIEVLYRGQRFSQVYTPSWSPDGRAVAFSLWEAGGYRDIAVLDLASHTLTRVTRDRAMDLDPIYTRDGRFVVFTSDRSGIYNIYAYEVATGKLRQATNVLGGAFQPAVSPDGTLLAYQGFGANGYDIHVTAFAPDRFLAALPYANTRADADRIPDLEPPPPDRPYRALRSVWPRTYSLDYAPDSFGQALTVTTNGGDAVGLHAWALSLTYGFERSTVNVGANYWYSGLWPSLGLGVFRRISQRGGFYVNGVNRTYVETDVGGQFGVSLPIYQSADRGVSLSAAYRFEYLKNLDRDEVPPDPNQRVPGLPEEGRLASVSASAGYNDAQSFLYSVSPERGRWVHLGLSVFDPVFGSEYRIAQVDWSWTEFLRNPFLRHHVLALRYAGGIGMGNLMRRGVFWLGGYSRDPDVLRTYIDPREPRWGGPALRGYPPYSLWGDQFHLLNAEYRFPIARVERGVLTLPLYVSKLYGAVYTDCGNAFYGDFDPAALKVGVGAQVSLDTTIGYAVPATLTMGFARGLMEGGVNQFYLFVGGSF